MWRLLSRAAAMVCATVLFSGVINLNMAYAGQKITGPFSYENLAVYFIHGESAKGPVPLTLEEALAKGTARLLETGNVQMLSIENFGEEEVFIQAGDIVKGGQQDRVLSVSLLVPAKSGAVPISAFCVEQSRWARRGQEDPTRFASASTAMPTRKGKLAMRAASAPADQAAAMDVIRSGQRLSHSGRSASPQLEVWREVEAAQIKLSENVGTPIHAAESETSLQLSLENAKLKEAQERYVGALRNEGEKGEDIIGYAIAVNGKISSAEIYSSNGLFRKMWNKQLDAGAAEALSLKDAPGENAPKAEAVIAFLEDAEKGKPSVQNMAADTRLEVRHAPAAAMYEAQLAGRPSTAVHSEKRFFHRSYLRKD